MKQVTFAGLALLLAACAEATSPEAASRKMSPRLTGSAAAPEAVLPSGYTGMMGAINFTIPHAPFRPIRYQQVFLGSDLVDPAIVALCLRRDNSVFPTARETTFTLKLGPTTYDYTNLTREFDANYSAPPVEVFSGTLTIPAAPVAGTLTDFDFCIPFTQQYDHPAGANLIMEVITTVPTTGDAPRDACASTEAACTTAQAYTLSATATTATTATVLERQGLIVKLVSPAPPAPVDPQSEEECKKGGWSNFDFRNQGQCMRFIETGYDSRVETAG